MRALWPELSASRIASAVAVTLTARQVDQQLGTRSKAMPKTQNKARGRVATIDCELLRKEVKGEP